MPKYSVREAAPYDGQQVLGKLKMNGDKGSNKSSNATARSSFIIKASEETNASASVFFELGKIDEKADETSSEFKRTMEFEFNRAVQEATDFLDENGDFVFMCEITLALTKIKAVNTNKTVRVKLNAAGHQWETYKETNSIGNLKNAVKFAQEAECLIVELAQLHEMDSKGKTTFGIPRE